MKEEELCNHLIHASDGSRCANPKGKCIMHDTCDVLTEVDEHTVMKCHELKPCKIHGVSPIKFFCTDIDCPERTGGECYDAENIAKA